MHPLHQQRPRVRTHDAPSDIVIPQQPHITLRHVLRFSKHPCRRVRAPLLLHRRVRLLAQPIPQRRMHRPRADQIHPNRLHIQGQPPRHSMQARRIAIDYRPIRHRLLAHRARGQHERRGRRLGQHARGVLGDDQRSEEARHARLLDERQGDFVERHRRQLVAGGVDDVVERAALGEQAGDVRFQRVGGGEVAGEAAEAGFGGRVRGQEGGDGGVDARGLRGGEDDGGVGFEAGFGDGVADAGGAADDAAGGR